MSVAIPPLPMQQSVPKLPPHPNMPSASTPLTWLPPVTTNNIPDPDYTDIGFVDKSSLTLQSAVMFAVLNAQCLGFSMTYGRVPRSHHVAMSRKDGP